jgi:hypothetical protein
MVEGKTWIPSVFKKNLMKRCTLILKGFKQLLKKVLHFLWFLDQPLFGGVWDEMDDGLDA